MSDLFDFEVTADSQLPKKSRDDKKIVLERLKDEPYALIFASKRLRSDMEVVLSALSYDPSAIQFIGQELLDDKDSIEHIKKLHPTINIPKSSRDINYKYEGDEFNLEAVFFSRNSDEKIKWTV